ncbi:MAG: hypothetical protein MEQ74_13560 [Paracoccus sp.]|nr:hypothetical protein [Paracoccus sp. (in: a-proteobacteria)]
MFSIIENSSVAASFSGIIEADVGGSKPGTRVAAGCYHIQNVNSLHARYGKFIDPFCRPATKNLNGYIRWLEVRMAGGATGECDQGVIAGSHQGGPDRFEPAASGRHDPQAQQAGMCRFS